MPPAKNVQVKGLAVRGAFEWILRTQGKPVSDQVLAQLSEADRAAVTTAQPSGWYPVVVLSVLLGSYARVLGTDAPHLETNFRLMGAYVAETNLTTIYRVMLAFVNPSTLPTHLPRLWSNYFTGLDVQVQRLAPNQAHMLTSPMDQLSYISPASAGWIEFAYRHVGAKHVSVREKNFSPKNPAPPILAMDIEWR